MVSSACSSSGTCVAAALSSGQLLVHALGSAGLSSSNGDSHLGYRLVADTPLPAAASQLVFLDSLPALALAAACGNRHGSGLDAVSKQSLMRTIDVYQHGASARA